MKEWYKMCPYCWNEIKEWAIKCQYCYEFLDEKHTNWDLDSHESNDKYIAYKPWYKKIWSWIIICFILSISIYNIFVRIEKKNANDKINDFYDKIIENNWDVDDIDFNDTISAAKKNFNDKYSQEFFDGLNNILTNYDTKVDSIWDLYIVDIRDLKNIYKLNEVITNWKIYISISEQYEREFFDLMSNLDKKYWVNWLTNSNAFWDNLSKLVSGIKRFWDVNMELYSYILSVQNDFYIDYNDSIIFYNESTAIDKFYNLWEKWLNESDIFDELYDEISKSMVEYAKNAKTK